MLYWSVVFFVLSLASALFGFGHLGIAGSGVAQFLFVIFLSLSVITYWLGRRIPH